MKRYVVSALFASIVLGTSAASAQTPPAQPASAGPPPPVTFATFLKNQNNLIKRNLIASAEKMPEPNYAFKPTPEVRSFGELLGHVIDSSYFYCSRVKGEANPVAAKSFEKVAAKADLVKGIKDAVAYCDSVYDALTDANVVEIIKVPGPNNTQREIARANQLTLNLAHNNEHYGNIVTYLRLKGIVPPSSEPPPAK
jgi:uncharacterized damage-inducible protein DinB